MTPPVSNDVEGQARSPIVHVEPGRGLFVGGGPVRPTGPAACSDVTVRARLGGGGGALLGRPGSFCLVRPARGGAMGPSRKGGTLSVQLVLGGSARSGWARPGRGDCTFSNLA